MDLNLNIVSIVVDKFFPSYIYMFYRKFAWMEGKIYKTWLIRVAINPLVPRVQKIKTAI